MTPRRGLTGRDYVFDDSDLPAWVPGFVRRLLLDLVYDEGHAMLLGLVGLLAGVGWRSGFMVETGVFTLAAMAVAFGLKRADPDGKVPWAHRVLGKEPWYFTTVYLLSALAGAGIAGL